MTADTQARPEDTTDKPKRKFKFPTAFTVLFFVLVLVWILTFIIPPGSYSYVSCDGGTPKPIPGTFGAVKVDLSFQERLYDLWVSPVNGLYGVRTPSEVVPDPNPDLLKKGQTACGTVAGKQVPAEIVTAFVDSELEALLGIDGAREGMACLVALGRTEAPAAQPPALEPFPFEAIPLSSREVTYDELVKIHGESRLESREEVEAVTSAKIATRASSAATNQLRFETIDPDDSAPLGATILRRGSTRVFARAPISRDELATIMAGSRRHPRSDFPRLTDTYLIVNAVEAMEPGAYYYRRETGSFELLKRGEFRADAGYLCLEQPLGMDCSALVVYAADLESALGVLGNRAYRDVHLEAGILGGRAYLAAYALGRGATGLTFYDDDTSKFFGPHAAGTSPLLMVALGVPRSAAQDPS